MDIQIVLEELARKRPIFHNEADFQHALAWEIREQCESKIRLERLVEIESNRRTYLDIWVEKDGRRTAIELKYKTRAFEYTIEGEKFSLRNQGAHDIGRYDVIKDLQRLEQMVKRNVVDEGYLIFLTNDTSYYQNPVVKKETVDGEFRIHDGRILTGMLSWGKGTGEGTMKGREEPIVLEHTYAMIWKTYSHLDHTPFGTIHCLIVPVGNAVHNVVPDQQAYKPETHVEPALMAPLNEISSIVRSIRAIPISQFDLRDKMAARLKGEGYHVQMNRNLGDAKVDIWVENESQPIAIEIRYKTAILRTTFNGNEIELKNQGAQDISRYDFIKDIEKLEKVIEEKPGTKGFAILVTNDHNYWKKMTRSTSVDKGFRIHHGRILNGRLSWNCASKGTTKNREESIEIKGKYTLQWQPFLTLGNGKNETFQMLVVQV